MDVLRFSFLFSCSRLEHLQGDVIAGLTVGLTVIPQGLAYAQVAELPPQVRDRILCQVNRRFTVHFIKTDLLWSIFVYETLG